MPTRLHYMDNLRALAMLVGVFFHAALAYSPFMKELWIAADDESLRSLDVVAWFTHLFRMPLFFLVSGFFAHLLVERKGLRGFLKNRWLRVVLPFVLFLPPILLMMMGVVWYGTRFLDLDTVLVRFITGTLQDWPNGKGKFTTSHLWFLYCLFWFALATGVAVKWSPIRVRAVGFFASPWFVLLILPLILVPALATQMVPHPAAEDVFLGYWAFGFFGVFFFCGWLFWDRFDSWLAIVERFWPLMLAITLVSYGYYYSCIPQQMPLSEVFILFEQPRAMSFDRLPAALSGAFVSVYATFLSLFAAQKYLRKESRVMRFIADSSYWVYIVHLPILLFIQIHLIRLTMPAALKYIVVVAATFLVGMLSYQWCVRGRALGRLLNGH